MAGSIPCFAPTSANPIASQSWINQTPEPDAVYANRRIRGDRGQPLLRKRGELLERPCAHLYETGGLRRAHVRGHENVLKRLLVHAGAFNLGLWMRTLFGVGTPRSLQGWVTALGTVLSALGTFGYDAVTALCAPSTIDAYGWSPDGKRRGWRVGSPTGRPGLTPPNAK